MLFSFIASDLHAQCGCQLVQQCLYELSHQRQGVRRGTAHNLIDCLKGLQLQPGTLLDIHLEGSLTLHPTTLLKWLHIKLLRIALALQ